MTQKDEIIKTYQNEDIVKTFDDERAEFLYQRYKTKLECNLLTKAMGYTTPLKVLDVGCGTGRMQGTVLDVNAEYYGLDTSPEMLYKIPVTDKTNLIIADATKIPFPNNYFDVTYTFHLLWHLPLETQQLIIKEMIRVTKQKGIILFDTVNKDFIIKKLKKQTENIYPVSLVESYNMIEDNVILDIEKLNDPKVNDLIFSAFNIVNHCRYMLPKSWFHMLYFIIKKK
jgi:ubiquinone/menaquinone biosynthesis C-methylase UbiE